MNGSPIGFFKPSRELRQGDPLSLFLFIIGSEIFSRMIIHEEQVGRIHGISLDWGVLAISHLLFPDDLLIFCHAFREEALVLCECL